MEEKKYDDTNRGTLWLDENKKSEKHPDFSGKLNIAGVEHYVSGWKRTTKTDKHVIDLSLGKVVEAKQEDGSW